MPKMLKYEKWENIKEFLKETIAQFSME